MPEPPDSYAAGIGAQARREMVVVPVVGDAALHAHDALAARINIFVGGSGGKRAVVVFGKNLLAEEDADGRGAARGFDDALAIAVIGVGAGISPFAPSDFAPELSPSSGTVLHSISPKQDALHASLTVFH